MAQRTKREIATKTEETEKTEAKPKRGRPKGAPKPPLIKLSPDSEMTLRLACCVGGLAAKKVEGKRLASLRRRKLISEDGDCWVAAKAGRRWVEETDAFRAAMAAFHSDVSKRTTAINFSAPDIEPRNPAA